MLPLRSRTGHKLLDRKNAPKIAAVSVLIAQNSALALVMRRTRMREISDMYIPSTAVVMAELLKILVSVVMQAILDGSFSAAFSTVWSETAKKPREMQQMAVPAALYTTQNLLSYIATSALDAPTYQVLCQSKILVTAILSVLLLAKPISPRQWRALLLLTCGVTAVQLLGGSGGGDSDAAAASMPAAPRALVGCTATVTLCLCSGLAGVYFEKVVKATPVSLWVRNVQLSLYGVTVAFATVFGINGSAVSAGGFFRGYSPLVWLCIALHSLGGLAVAVVVKYADNVVKLFATSASIVLSAVISSLLTGVPVTSGFAAGTVLVITATFLYNTPPPLPPTEDAAVAATAGAAGAGTAAGVSGAAAGTTPGRSLRPKSSPSADLERRENSGGYEAAAGAAAAAAASAVASAASPLLTRRSPRGGIGRNPSRASNNNDEV